jgi:hypothetical protein
MKLWMLLLKLQIKEAKIKNKKNKKMKRQMKRFT